MKKIRVGGVPEHFNYPWHYGISEGIFKNYGLDVEWIDIKGGSGAMCAMLESGELDFALVLTEGIVKHIHKGGTARILQQYVKSPLTWGVHSSNQKNLDANDLSKARFARSRPGSGSHLMAYVHAEEKNYRLTEENFVTVGNIDGAIESFENNTADILLWEKFMTQPYVTKGLAKRLDLCVSPWPCFMLVAAKSQLQNSKTLTSIGSAILLCANNVSESADTIAKIAAMYNLKTEQVEQWYSGVEWQTSPWISQKMLRNVINTLNRVSILGSEPLAVKELCLAEAKLY